MTFLRLACLFFLALATSAQANDSTAELGTGGIKLTNTSSISMDKEVLFISPSKVTVDYEFTNTSEADIHSVVAFPMPDISGGLEQNVALGDRNADNFLGFTVTQDGETITPELQQRIIAYDLDVTDEVVAAGVPLLPQAESAEAALKKLPAELLADWADRGIIYMDTYDTGNGMESHPTPLWTLKSAYWWKTTFPAGKTVTVSHSYTPSIGGTVAVTFVGQYADEARLNEYKKRYCMDDGFIKAAAKLPGYDEAKNDPGFVEHWLKYVLSSGANWQGPIKDFTLVIDKGKPENLISFCGEGVTKTGPTTFEMKKTDFNPEGDLDILLLSKPLWN